MNYNFQIIVLILLVNNYLSVVFAQSDAQSNKNIVNKTAVASTSISEVPAAEIDGSVISISSVDGSIKSRVEKIRASIYNVYKESLYKLLYEQLSKKNSIEQLKIESIIKAYNHELDKLTARTVNQTAYLRRRAASKYVEISNADGYKERLVRLQQEGKLIINMPSPEELEKPVAPEITIAKLGSLTIQSGQIEDLQKLKLFQLRGELYYLRKHSLDKLIEMLLLKRAANAKGMSLKEIENSLLEIKATDRQIEEFIQSQKEMGKSVDRIKAIPYVNFRFRYSKRKQMIKSQRIHAKIEYLLFKPAWPKFAVDRKLGISYALADDRKNLAPDRDPDIVLFSNYRCDVCRQILRQIEKLLELNPKLAVKHYDFMQLTDTVALDGALLASCANRQGKYVAMKNYLLNSNPPDRNKLWFDKSHLNGFLHKHGIKPDLFDQCLDDVTVQQVIEKTTIVANQIGFTNPPAFLLHGIPLSGFHTAEELNRKLSQHRSD